MKLFKCNTINQFKIGVWLAEQGVTRDDILVATMMDPNTVKIANPAGQYMVIHWRDGHAEIEDD